MFFKKENSGINTTYNIVGLRLTFKNKKLMLVKIKELEDNISQFKERFRKITPNEYLRNFEVHLVEHCNLRCQGCNHFSPLAEECFMDIENFTRDFKRMSELTEGNVDYINLLGGEPLLHPNLLEFFPIARKLFPKTTINVVTNGILLATQKEDFWSECSKNKITICITTYPININIDKIKEKVKQNNIDLKFWSESGTENLKYSWFYPLDSEGTQDMTDSFVKCRDANSCIFLRDGKLFTCDVAPNIHHFNKYFNKQVPICEDDYIDIYKAKNINEILKFLCQPIPFCKYCNVNKRTFDSVWGKSEKDINEWTIKS